MSGFFLRLINQCELNYQASYSSTMTIFVTKLLYTVSQKTGPLRYSQIFPTDLDQY